MKAHQSDRSSVLSGIRRRQFVKTAAAASASAVAFASLGARGAAAQLRAPFSRDYGPLAPVKDQATGLYLISLPKGFEYTSYGWTGMIMADGQPTPTDHDGMAVVGQRARTLALVRNHEQSGEAQLRLGGNIAISPRGGIVLCEAGGHDPQRLIGLDARGEVFPFAENLIDLAAGDIDKIDAAFPGAKQHFTDDPVGVYTDQEWAGATFHGPWLFANIQTPGVTFAITGPWRKGSL